MSSGQIPLGTIKADPKQPSKQQHLGRPADGVSSAQENKGQAGSVMKK